MSRQNQLKDFPQNSRKSKNVVIMNMDNSIALDPYKPVYKNQGFKNYKPEISQLISSKTVYVLVL